MSKQDTAQLIRRRVAQSMAVSAYRLEHPSDPATVMASPPTIAQATSSGLTSPIRVNAMKSVTASITSGSTAVTATSGTFDSADNGRGCAASANIPTGTTLTVVDSTHATLSQAATGTSAALSLTINRPNSAQYRFLGSDLLGWQSNVFPGFNAVYTSGASTYAIPDAFAVRGAHYGQKLEFVMTGQAAGTSTCRIYVDTGTGWQAATASYISLLSTSSIQYLTVDFGSVAFRRIHIDFGTSAALLGVNIQGTDTWWRGDGAAPVRVVWASDSYVEGLFGGNKHRPMGPYGTASRLLGWGEPMNRGQASTGYLNAGQGVRTSNAILRARIPEIIGCNPDGVVVAAGVNDRGQTQAAVQTEAAACFALLLAGLPNARIYIVGPWQASDGITGLAAVSAGVRAAALAAGLPYIEPSTGAVVAGDGTVLVPGTGLGWIQGTNSSTTQNGGAFFHTDNLHQTQVGYDYLGHQMAAGIAVIENYIATGRVTLAA